MGWACGTQRDLSKGGLGRVGARPPGPSLSGRLPGPASAQWEPALGPACTWIRLAVWEPKRAGCVLVHWPLPPAPPPGCPPCR